MTTRSLETDPLFGPDDDRIERDQDPAGYNARSLYNVRGFEPVRTEFRHGPVEISGRLPADLEGVYLRNGTNVPFDRSHVRTHTFNGPGMLHQIDIHRGVATYSNTYVRTPRFDAEERAGREVYLAFSDLAGGGRATLEKMQLLEAKKRRGSIPPLSPFESTTASTSVQFHAGKLYCLQETGYPFVLEAGRDGERLTLDGTGYLESWNGELRSAFSAHPRIDPVTGDFYNVGLDRVGGGIFLSQVSDGALRAQRLVHQQTEATGRTAYVHDYFLTDRYLVFADTSLRSDAKRLASDTGSVFFFDPAYRMRWGVVPRDPSAGDEGRWFDMSSAGTMWHTINGWEEPSPGGGTQIVLYAPVFDGYPPDIPIHTPAEPAAKVYKFVLDLESGRVSERLLLDHGYERPSINLAYTGKPNRFAYLLDEERAHGYMGKGVLKYDLLDEREAGYLDYGDEFGGEPLFVPKRDAIDEDDGYLLDLLMTDDAAALVVMDARTLTEVARLGLPARVPFGVHACWLDEEKLAALS
ncbi:MAG: carotenoid oxygenase family protein [Candidatus Eremiobacteraeota bacterium]|nr:carotenoid oxygenase family protein [Candidatus Eremiobacteraeota bacterium]